MSLNIHTQTKTHKSQHSTHSHWIESTTGRAHRKTNRALGCLNTILTMQLWLSLPQFSHSFNVMCVTDDSNRRDQRANNVVIHHRGVKLDVFRPSQNVTTVDISLLCVWVIRFKLRMKKIYPKRITFMPLFLSDIFIPLLFSRISTTQSHFPYET